MVEYVLKGTRLRGEEYHKWWWELDTKYLAGGEVLVARGDQEKVLEFARSYPGGRFRLAVWEEGGSMTMTGQAQVVAGLDGKPLRPAFVIRKGERACSRHALFTGRRLATVWASRSRDSKDFSIKKLECDPVTGNVEVAVLHSASYPVAVSCRSGGRLEFDLPPEAACFLPAVQAALQKAACYHCRRPHYICS
jgi:hypothetical protein